MSFKNTLYFCIGLSLMISAIIDASFIESIIIGAGSAFISLGIDGWIEKDE